MSSAVHTTNKMLAATLVGFGMGLLFAPKSGRETRADLSAKAADVKNKATDAAQKARSKVNELQHKGTEAMDDLNSSTM